MERYSFEAQNTIEVQNMILMMNRYMMTILEKSGMNFPQLYDFFQTDNLNMKEKDLTSCSRRRGIDRVDN